MEPRTYSNGAEHRGEPWSTPGVPAGGPAFGAAASFKPADVDGYELHGLIRRAPATDVYRARHRVTNASRDVVVVHDLPGVDRTALRRAAEEYAAAVRTVLLGQPGVFAVEKVGLTGDGRVYAAAARPVGFTLREVLADGTTLSVRRARRLGLAIASTVAAAHDAGVVHGRLTPDAVVLMPHPLGGEERVAVCGFGTAPVQDATLLPGAVPDDQRPFVGPERAAGGPPSARDDVYGLASLLLLMCTGALPAAGQAVGHPMAGEIAGVLQRARDAEPGRRYASAREFAAALARAGDGAGGTLHSVPAPAPAAPAPAAPAPPSQPLSQPLSQWRALVAAGAVGAVLATGGAVAWHLYTMPRSGSPLDQTARVRAEAEPVRRDSLPSAASVPAASVATAPPPIAAGTTPRAEAEAVSPSRTPAPAAPREPAAAAERTATERAGVERTAAVRTRTEGAPAGVVTSGADATTRGGRASTSSAVAGEVTAAGSAARTRAAEVTRGPGTAPDAGVGAGAADAPTAEAKTAADVHAAVTEYGSAVESRDLARLARVYPGMPEEQRRAWASFFESVSGLRARLVVDQISVSGATALARVRGTYEYENLRPHRAERRPVSFKATLVRGASGWRVRAVE